MNDKEKEFRVMFREISQTIEEEMNDKEKDEMLRAMFGEISQTIEEEADSKIHDAVCMEKFEYAAKIRDMRNHILGEIERVFKANGMTEDIPF